MDIYGQKTKGEYKPLIGVLVSSCIDELWRDLLRAFEHQIKHYNKTQNEML
jgi:hypothetical protein